ncbi:hypothetical protein K502DRAFT_329744 [Neoconidiobolus thromboides FSU 785]|nr:hypothetical protein K502DRAFT_329744 [Neoconidiobolus thromboides FSU 785]
MNSYAFKSNLNRHYNIHHDIVRKEDTSKHRKHKNKAKIKEELISIDIKQEDRLDEQIVREGQGDLNINLSDKIIKVEDRLVYREKLLNKYVKYEEQLVLESNSIKKYMKVQKSPIPKDDPSYKTRFKCVFENCSKSYSRKNDLKVHFINKHGPVGKRSTFKCIMYNDRSDFVYKEPNKLEKDMDQRTLNKEELDERLGYQYQPAKKDEISQESTENNKQYYLREMQPSKRTKYQGQSILKISLPNSHIKLPKPKFKFIVDKIKHKLNPVLERDPYSEHIKLPKPKIRFIINKERATLPCRNLKDSLN